HAVRRGDDQRLLGPGARPGRSDARGRELHLGPDHLHHPGQEAGRSVLPRGPSRLLRGRPGSDEGREGQLPPPQGGGEGEEQARPIVDFEALFIPDEWQRGGLVAPALAVEDIITNTCDPREIENLKKTTGKKDIRTVTLLGGNGWNSPKNSDGIPQLVERGGKFVLCSVFVDGFYADSSRESTKRFVRLFSEAYKDSTPTLLDAVGFDSARMLRQILDKQTASLDRAAVRDALAGTRDFEGATGKTSFNEKREAQKPLFFLTIDPKGMREIQPTERLSGS